MRKVLDSIWKWCYYKQMLASEYIEDIFLTFSDLVAWDKISYQHQDHKPILSFRTIIKNKSALTQKQANFMLILLKKYKKQLSAFHNIDITDLLDNPKWRSTFRTIDYTKSIEIIKNEEGILLAKLRFPYNLKDEFEKDIDNGYPKISAFDHEERCRYVPLLKVNSVKLLDFCIKHGFHVSPEFSDYVDFVEEVWQHENEIAPFCEIENSSLELRNVIEYTKTYFDSHKKNNIFHDAFLARQMGIPLNTDNKDIVSKICSSNEKLFWSNSMDNVAEMIAYCDLDKVALIIDRTSNVVEFIEDLLDKLSKHCYNIENIRVCFRDSNTSIEGRAFNTLIKEKGIGGPIDTGKLFIFKHSIPKWAKKSATEFNLVLTNSITVPTNISTRNFMKECHAVLTVSEYKPTVQQGNKIVEL